jgi:uncharacterized protein YbcI
VVECLRAFHQVGFFIWLTRLRWNQHLMNEMNPTKRTIPDQVAHMASALQQQRTGHAPKTVNVILSNDTLVITLHEALSPAEQVMAKTPKGAARMQEFHRQLFQSSADSLRTEIKRITGRDVREAAAEIDSATGSVVHAFTTGTMVQVFLLTENVLTESGSERGASD